MRLLREAALVTAGLCVLLAVFAFGTCLRAAAADTSSTPGWASYFGLSPELDGQIMANGGRYHSTMKVAATPLWRNAEGALVVPHWPLGTRLRVTAWGVPTPDHPDVLRSVEVEITDSCVGCRADWPWIDLSVFAYRSLAPLETGMIQVFIEVLPEGFE